MNRRNLLTSTAALVSSSVLGVATASASDNVATDNVEGPRSYLERDAVIWHVFHDAKVNDVASFGALFSPFEQITYNITRVKGTDYYDNVTFQAFYVIDVGLVEDVNARQLSKIRSDLGNEKLAEAFTFEIDSYRARNPVIDAARLFGPPPYRPKEETWDFPSGTLKFSWLAQQDENIPFFVNFYGKQHTHENYLYIVGSITEEEATMGAFEARFNNMVNALKKKYIARYHENPFSVS